MASPWKGLNESQWLCFIPEECLAVFLKKLLIPHLKLPSLPGILMLHVRWNVSLIHLTYFTCASGKDSIENGRKGEFQGLKRKKNLEPQFKRWLNKIFVWAVSKWTNQISSPLFYWVGKSKPWPFCCCEGQHLIGITGLRGATVWNCESKEKLSVLYFAFLTTAQKQAQKNDQHVF